MKNFSSEFRKSVKDMKPDKSEILHTVRNSGRNTGIVPVRQGFGARVGSLLTAGIAVVLVFGIIVGGGLLRGMKKPLSPGGNNYGHGSNVLEDPNLRPDTETTLIHYGTDYDSETAISTCHYGPPDTSADSETEPPSSGTEYPEDTNTEPPTDSAPVDPPDKDPDIVFSYDPIDDFGIDVLKDAESVNDLLSELSDNDIPYWEIFYEAVYTVGGVEKTGRMFMIVADSLPVGNSDTHIPSIYLILCDPDTNNVLAAKKWVMAGGVFVNSDIPGTFLVAGVSYDLSDDVYGYFGVYRVTDSVTGELEFVLDTSYDSCKIHRTFFPARVIAGLVDEELETLLRDEKYNENYYQRLCKLIEDNDYGQILDMYGGPCCLAGDGPFTPTSRIRGVSDLALNCFYKITNIAAWFGKN